MINMKMKFFIVFFLILNFTNYLLAGAPPLNKVPIPPAPHSLVKTNHLIIGVEWDKNTLKDLLPKKLLNKSTITGGINIFNSKKKQAFSPLSGSYAWIDFSEKRKKEKLIIFSIYGPNKTINNVMKSVYNLNSYIGSNKVTLINDKAIATASINKKNVLNLLSSGIEKCSKSTGNDFLVTKFSTSEKIFKKVIWYSDEECIIKPEKVEFQGDFEKFKIKKMLWAKIQKNSEVIFDK